MVEAATEGVEGLFMACPAAIDPSWAAIGVAVANADPTPSGAPNPSAALLNKSPSAPAPPPSVNPPNRPSSSPCVPPTAAPRPPPINSGERNVLRGAAMEVGIPRAVPRPDSGAAKPPPRAPRPEPTAPTISGMKANNGASIGISSRLRLPKRDSGRRRGLGFGLGNTGRGEVNTEAWPRRLQPWKLGLEPAGQDIHSHPCILSKRVRRCSKAPAPRYHGRERLHSLPGGPRPPRKKQHERPRPVLEEKSGQHCAPPTIVRPEEPVVGIEHHPFGPGQRLLLVERRIAPDRDVQHLVKIKHRAATNGSAAGPVRFPSAQIGTPQSCATPLCST